MSTSQAIVNAGITTGSLLPKLRSHPWVGSRKPKTLTRAKPVATVGRLLAGALPMPAPTLLLGKCEDGLPLLMTLDDPAIGATLIGCQAGYGKTHQLQVMVDSALRAHSPTEVQVAIFTRNTQEWAGFSMRPAWRKALRGLHAWYDPEAESLIATLTELAEARRDGQRQGTDVIVLLDDLQMVEDLSLEAQVNLRWLIEYGAQSGVWAIGTLNADHATRMGYWVEAFRTRIIGSIPVRQTAETLAMRPDLPSEHLCPAEFRVHTDQRWLTYALPPLGD